MTHAYERRPIAELYTWFAGEAEATSPTWGRLCRWIAEHPEINARLDALPGTKRQPNLFLAALKYLGGPLDPGPAFVAWVEAHWDAVEGLVLARATQTNEPGRCAVLAPLLAALPQPISLLEIGSSAGLCLLPDRYRYAWGGEGGEDGEGGAAFVTSGGLATPDAPVLPCAVTGRAPADPAVLSIAARCGLDRAPLDPADPEDAAWLRALVWPGEDARERRLDACLRLAAGLPRRRRPEVLAGDARDERALDALLARVAPGSTPVLQHAALAQYLTRDERDRLAAWLRASGVRWISYEGPTVLPGVRARLADADAWRDTPHFVVALDGEPVARASAHGGWVRWS